tara:strand:+ start:191 stop:484 length:294 start_codon:yes stop_codon:yes gene_type:complete
MSRLEKKSQDEDNQKFASKKQGIFIFLPCWITIGAGCLHIAMGLEATHYLITGSLLALVCGSLGQLRAKIIQQNQTIQILQEKLVEVCGTDLRRSKN